MCFSIKYNLGFGEFDSGPAARHRVELFRHSRPPRFDHLYRGSPTAAVKPGKPTGVSATGFTYIITFLLVAVAATTALTAVLIIQRK